MSREEGRASAEQSPDGSRATAYTQSFTTPWLALSRALGEQTLAYISWGRGVETEVVPNRSRYTNRGQALPALESRQLEGGVKHADADVDWSVTAFDIRRPLAQDFCAGPDATVCTRTIDGAQRHRGLEASWQRRTGAWSTKLSALWLHAERVGAMDAADNGLRPVNVPASSLRAEVGHDLSVVPGLTLLAYLTTEGNREVLPDNSITIPAWTRVDLAARYRGALGPYPALWQAGVDNATGQRAWREAPYQFGHVYLFPMAPRTWRASVQVMF